MALSLKSLQAPRRDRALIFTIVADGGMGKTSSCAWRPPWDGPVGCQCPRQGSAAEPVASGVQSPSTDSTSRPYNTSVSFSEPSAVSGSAYISNARAASSKGIRGVTIGPRSTLPRTIMSTAVWK